eukprot:5523160-Karenia_brevis.AAC.1
MDEAEKLVGETTGIVDGGALLQEDEQIEKSQALHAILINTVKLESEPFKILENHDAKGVECWRLFHKRWNRTSPMTSMDVTEKIQKITRAKNTDEVQTKLQELMTLVQEWEKARSLGGSKVKYDDVLLKADYFRIIPETWATKIKLDAEVDYMFSPSTVILEKIDLYTRTSVSYTHLRAHETLSDL